MSAAVATGTAVLSPGSVLAQSKSVAAPPFTSMMTGGSAAARHTVMIVVCTVAGVVGFGVLFAAALMVYRRRRHQKASSLNDRFSLGPSAAENWWTVGSSKEAANGCLPSQGAPPPPAFVPEERRTRGISSASASTSGTMVAEEKTWSFPSSWRRSKRDTWIGPPRSPPPIV